MLSNIVLSCWCLLFGSSITYGGEKNDANVCALFTQVWPHELSRFYIPVHAHTACYHDLGSVIWQWWQWWHCIPLIRWLQCCYKVKNNAWRIFFKKSGDIDQHACSNTCSTTRAMKDATQLLYGLITAAFIIFHTWKVADTKCFNILRQGSSGAPQR